MPSDTGDEESCAKPLGRLPVLFYGVGHMLNDITSACWFTYLLVFLTEIGLSPRNAAVVMLSGQVADAFTTIFAGELIDRFGHFKIWHGAGSVLVAVSFSSVFGGCLPCNILGTDSSTLETIGYSTFAAIFNVGWAATQVSHMAMVNCITLDSTNRVVLNSCRNAFTMVANLTLYAVALIVFNLSSSATLFDIENQYRWIAYLSIFIGCCFVGIFLLWTKEPRLKQGVHGRSYARISWSYWFKKLLYYQVALVYMLTRLVTNVSQSFLAFFVINELRMAQSSKALVPGIIYICSFIVSILLQEISWTGKRVKGFYSAGGVLWILCGASILFLPSHLNFLMYPLSIVIGIANALIMVTAISMQSFLVGQDLNGCAFVYGSLSFLDKMSCGIALYLLESYQISLADTSRDLQGCNAIVACFTVTRNAFGLVPAICALIGVVATYTMELHTSSPKPILEPLLLA
ncbi:major facilitator superfamily domain-containing protein 12-like isoform X1 [Impatiens glandulifera]|uniref:major facilitator superfamily domain-containing protein 12-like isoform X1 n=1 Tax=Impatiens glandulifera TaxID=253017 RepID=UPI001FB19A1A|nr:major facilitator superfamily domain-containing protein 12-like isoform X1 [Impatiens glandulifera]